LNEQYDLWNILKNQQVNKLYFLVPSMFNENIKLFLEEQNN